MNNSTVSVVRKVNNSCKSDKGTVSRVGKCEAGSLFFTIYGPAHTAMIAFYHFLPICFLFINAGAHIADLD